MTEDEYYLEFSEFDLQGSIIIKNDQTIFISPIIFKEFPSLSKNLSTSELMDFFGISLKKSLSGRSIQNVDKYQFIMETSMNNGDEITSISLLKKYIPSLPKTVGYYRNFEMLVSSIAQDIAESTADSIDIVIDDSIEKLGKFAKVDRVYLFQPNDDETVSNTHEWCKEGIESYIDQLQNLPRSDFGWINKNIEKGQSVIFDNIDNLPKEAEVDRQLLAAQGIKSILIFPLSFFNATGFIGFDMVEDYVNWSNTLVSLIEMVGELLVTGIKRHKLYEEVLEVKSLNQLLIEYSPFGIAIHQDFQLKFLNPRARQMIGIESSRSLDTISIDEIVDPKYMESVIRYAKETYNGSKRSEWIEINLKTYDGRNITVSAIEVPFEYKNQPAAMTFLRDITMEKLLENEFKRTETKYKNLFDTSLDALYESSFNGKIIHWNKSFENLFGYTYDELVEIHAKELYYDPLDREIFLETLQEEGSINNFEIRLITKTGKILFCLISAFKAEEGEKMVRGIIKDITDVKLATEALISSEKLNSIGLLAGGIAHDINNMLTSVSGYASLISITTDSEEIKEMTNELTISADRATDLTDKLLAFSGKKIKMSEITVLTDEIAKMKDFLHLTIGKDSKIDLEFKLNDIGSVDIDTTQFSQVLVNLVKNASEAIDRPNGSITIETGIVNLNQDSAWDYQVIEPKSIKFGKYGVIVISDNGTGIENGVLQRIFEPFYSTKFHGRGLGLSACLGIMKSHNGGIAIKSKLGLGSKFYLFLPLIEKVVSESDQVVSLKNFSKRAKNRSGFKFNHILVLDDQKNILNISRDIFNHLGMKITTTSSTSEFFNYITNGNYDILMIDQTMPKITGIDVIEKIRTSYHFAGKIILMSGFSKEKFEEQFKDLKIDGYMRKPFNVKSIEKMLTKI